MFQIEIGASEEGDKSIPSNSLRSLSESGTSSGIPLKPCYGAADVLGLDFQEHLGHPGHFPYTRGLYESMYHERLWTMRQYAGYGTAEESNDRFKFLLEQGQTGLSVAFDLPTQLGMDSDHSLAAGEVGRVGVAVDTLEDLRILFKDIPLDKTSVSFTINSTAPIILAMYIVLAEDRGVQLEALRGTVQNDVLKEYIARGTWIFPPRASLGMSIDIIEHCANFLPGFHPISICGYHIREAGSDAIEELAITLLNATTYIESSLERGMSIDEFAPRLSFFLSVSNDLFEEVAKFRAARNLWAHLLRDSYGAKNPKSWQCRIAASCSGSTLTAEQPENNIVRLAYETLAAVLGGVQSLFTCAWDEPFSIPTEESARLALRTQQILAYETGVPRVADPLGGSYFVERLTNEFALRVRELMEEMKEHGDMISQIETGHVQQLVSESAYRQQQAIDDGTKSVIGVNLLRGGEKGEKRSVFTLSSDSTARQLSRLQRIRDTRDSLAVSSALDHLKDAAKGGKNLMPCLINASRRLATIGEMTSILKSVYGQFREPPVSL